MRLTLKITIAILLGVVLAFSFHSYLSIQRERTELKERLGREALHLGRSLRVMTTNIWSIAGEQAALRFLSHSNIASGAFRVRWVWLGPEMEKRFQPQVPENKLSPLSQGKEVSVFLETPAGRDFLVTYLPLRTGGDRLGAIELSKSLDELQGYVQESLRRSALLMTATVASGLLLMALLGSIWINRPVRKLAEQAERIGRGDFSTAVDVTGRDELGGLAAAIDRMRSQLAASRQAEKEANEARLQALEKLRHTERLATLGHLSAGMAHELGTPLNVIAGRAKLISQQYLSPEEAARSARIIGEQAERMNRIISQLLDFARRGQARKQPVELGGLLKGVTELLAPTCRKRAIEMNRPDSGEAVTVEADPGQLQQVLLNLAMNGIQAMPDGGTLALRLMQAENPVRPGAQTAETGPWCAVQVEDQGRGIAPEDLPHIFDPFFTTKDVGEGTGLGLSIAYGIVEEHGGWIEVASTPGQGCLFTVYLPQQEEQA
jgi:signal transduction histidine kinase